VSANTPQQLERAFRQGHITILGAFAVADVNYHPRAVDVGDAQIGAFLQTQTAGVNGGETNSVARQSEARENLAHFGDAEDDGQLLLGRRAHDAEDVPVAIESLLVHKLDATDGDGHGGARVLLDVHQVGEVLAQLFLGDLVGRLVIMFAQLAHGSDVRLLGALRGPRSCRHSIILFRSSVMAIPPKKS